MARGVEQQSPPDEIFRSMVENAVHLCDGDNFQGNVVNELCSEEGLANVSILQPSSNLWLLLLNYGKQLRFILAIINVVLQEFKEMLRQDILRRLQDGSGP